jgi:hypothetical protein
MRLRILCLALLAGVLAFAADYEVVAYYFPNYHPDSRNQARYGKGWTEWELLKSARARFAAHQQPKVPAWGYTDESRPAVMERKIAAAADHGVTCFLYDWYWHDAGPFLDRGLEQGFLKANNRHRIKFALMWANHDWVELFRAKADGTRQLHYPGAVSRETFRKLTNHAIRQYFSQPNYWRIDGKPYFSIYELMTFVKGMGGLAQAREALEDFQARARQAGLPGVHVNAVDWGVNPKGIARDRDEMIRTLGIDSVTSYCWIHHTDLKDFPATSYAAWRQESTVKWREIGARFKVPYFPNVSMGWDSSPRTEQNVEYRRLGYPYTAVAAGNTPAEFQKALQAAKAFLDSRPGVRKIVTLNAWNEWTEGSYLEPDTRNGMGYLEAVRAVFSATTE